MTTTTATGEQRRRDSDARPRPYLSRLLDWLVSGPQPQPQAIVRRLLMHSQTKKRTLVLAIMSTTLMVSVTALFTGAIWAYAWLVLELLFGGARLAALVALQKAEDSGREGDARTPVLIGLAWATSYSIGCAMCVISGIWPLILMAGIVIAGLSGGISSRNAGTPRHGIALIYILGTPYTLAMIFSPIPHMYIVALLVPIYGVGVAFILLENYKVLLDLFLSEHNNHRLANYDSLTGLPNRIMKRERFDQLLRNAAGDSRKRRQPFMVLCLDLDGFKAANDQYGHAAGDAVLVTVADRLRAVVRDEDLIFRVGGDEFVILLPAMGPVEADAIAGRIIEHVAEPFDFGQGTYINIGISIGSACFPRDGQTADELLRSADSAMYEAKRLGRGLHVVHHAGPAEIVALVPAPDADARMSLPALDKAKPAARLGFAL